MSNEQPQSKSTNPNASPAIQIDALSLIYMMITLYMKVLPRMLGYQYIPLLRHRNMCVDLRDIDRAMPQHFLYIPDIHICLQKAGSEGMAEHMRRDMQVNGRQSRIPINHPAHRLVR